MRLILETWRLLTFSVRDPCNWTLCFCAHGPKSLSTSWLSFKTSRQMPKLIPDHRQHSHILAHRYQTGTICTGLIWYLLMSPESAHRTVMAALKCFAVFLRGKWISHPPNRMIRVEAEPGHISKYHMTPVLMVWILVTMYNYASQVAMIRSQSGASQRTHDAIMTQR